VVAKQVWVEVSEALGLNVGVDFLSTGNLWLCNKRFLVCNMVTSAVLWSIWKLRNNLCFQNAVRRSVGVLLMKIAFMLQNWLILCPAEKKDTLDGFVEKLQSLARRPRRIIG
jgi:hypothetical protein